MYLFLALAVRRTNVCVCTDFLFDNLNIKINEITSGDIGEQ